MNKRKLGSFALSAMLVALCVSAEAQEPKKVPRIGYLWSFDPATASVHSDAIRQALRELGYTDGQNIVIEYRYAEGNVDRFSELAAGTDHMYTYRLTVGCACFVPEPGRTYTFHCRSGTENSKSSALLIRLRVSIFAQSLSGRGGR